MELVGSYVDPDGQQQVLRVPCEAPDDDDAESFKSLLSGLAQMRELVRELLQDPLDPMAAVPDADSAQASDEGADLQHGPKIQKRKMYGNDEDDAEDENNIENSVNSEESTKRFKSST